MDNIKYQRIIYLIVCMYIIMLAIIGSHSCDSCTGKVEVEEQKPITYIVYIVEGAEAKEQVDSEVIEKIEETVKSEVSYFDVPLRTELQDHIFALCEDRGVDPALIMGMIKQESNFNIDAVGDDGNAHGLMQIWPMWHQSRMEEYRCTDLMDPFQNVTVGIDIIADWIEDGKGVEYALMGYNGGADYANRKYEAGEVSEYAQKVLAYAEEFEKERL